MSVFSRIAGIVGSFFQIGGTSGPAWKDDAGNLDARDPTDATFVNVRVADPVGTSDAVTLNYVALTNVTGLGYPALQFHKVAYYSGESILNGQMTPGLHFWGFGSLIFNGTISNPSNPAGSTATKLGATKRNRYSATAANSLNGFFDSTYVNAGVAQVGPWRGNAPNRGGFLFRSRFSITSIGNQSVLHLFVGLAETTGGSNTDWTTDATIAKIGIAFTCVTTAGSAFPAQNLQMIEGAHTPPVLHDLGPNFALTLNDFIEVIFFCTPNDTKVSYTVNNLTSGATISGIMNTNLPSTTTFLLPWLALGIGTSTSGTNSIDFSLGYLETFDG